MEQKDIESLLLSISSATNKFDSSKKASVTFEEFRDEFRKNAIEENALAYVLRSDLFDIVLKPAYNAMKSCSLFNDESWKTSMWWIIYACIEMLGYIGSFNE